jgi:hypothetical protein
MSTLIGQASEIWSLSRAIDALRDSARQAGRPGLVWIVGLLYPSIGIGLSWISTLTWSRAEEADVAAVRIHAPEPIWSLLNPFVIMPAAFGITLCIALTCFPLFRLVAGLARVSPPENWTAACEGRRTPRIRTLWANGSGMTLSVIALWILLVITIAASFCAVAWPAGMLVDPVRVNPEAAGPGQWMGVLFLGPLLILFLAYALSMAVLTQLALHSLAHNKRGIGSALLHGWRIMRHDVPATVRAVLVDVLLTVAILLVTTMVGSVIPLDAVDWMLSITLAGFAGVARAAYWARAYRALGGLSPDDGVPGLPAAPA